MNKKNTLIWDELIFERKNKNISVCDELFYEDKTKNEEMLFVPCQTPPSCPKKNEIIVLYKSTFF